MNTSLRHIWKRLKVVRATLLLLFVCCTLSGCEFKLSGMRLERADTLQTTTKGIMDARQAYLTEAQTSLANRGIMIALPPVADEALSIDYHNLAEDPDSLNAISTLSQCVLMTTGSNRDTVKGTFIGEFKENSTTKNVEIPYKLIYGTASYGGSINMCVPGNYGGGSPSGNAWILWLDFTNLGDRSNTVTWESIKGSLNLKETEWIKCQGTDGDFVYRGTKDSPHSHDPYFDVDEPFFIVWERCNLHWTLHESHPYPDADPKTDVYGAFGTDGVATFTKAYSSQAGYNVIPALFGVSSASTVVAPSNFILTNEAKVEYGLWMKRGGLDEYIRSGSMTNHQREEWNAFSWDGSGTVARPLPGYEPLTSSVIDYGHIWVLSPKASATQIRETQQMLNKFFAQNGAFSTTLTQGENLDGGAVLTGTENVFEETSLSVLPPGFGILCYSVIPREGGLCGITQSNSVSTANVGVVRAVYATGDNKPSVGLGFIGPNPQVLNAMNSVLSESGGGFAIINQHIYLMTYPVSTVSYLYTNEGSSDPCRAYIGLGAAPIYYNLVYDRLDYNYGEKYQFNMTASPEDMDPLYKDYNFVGGIAVKDSTGVTQSNGGVYILQDENGKNSTCRVQVADAKDIDEAKECLSELILNYYVPVVPLWDDDGVEGNGNQSPTVGGESVEALIKGQGSNQSWFDYNDGNGTMYFGNTTGYLSKWADEMKEKDLEVPQFVLMDYVETTLLPGGTATNNACVTGRKIRLAPDAIKYDEVRKLYYYEGRTGVKIGEYRTTDGSRKIDDLYLGDIVDIRSLGGVGYTKQNDNISWESIQPPYGYNSLFPIGIEFSAYNGTTYANHIAKVDKSHGNDLVSKWVGNNVDSTRPLIENFGTMSYWDGVAGTLADSSYYQTVSVVNNTSVLTAVQDATGASVMPDAVVACLNISGAEQNAHLGETTITQDTRIDELPYVCTNIITFSEPFPNTMFYEEDCKITYGATMEAVTTPNTMYTIAVGTGITHGNFYHAWVTSEAPTDSLAWWNGYLEAHKFGYRVNAQIVKRYLETNYSYLANEDNRLRFDAEGAQYWSEELDDLNPKRGGNRTVNLVMTLSNVFGWLCIVYALVCLLFWAVDIYAGLDKDFYKMLTGGRYVASAEAMPPTQHVHYATFLNALARSVIICIAGVVLIYVGAAVILAKMFKFLALVLRLIAGYWKQ